VWQRRARQRTVTDVSLRTTSPSGRRRFGREPGAAAPAGEPAAAQRAAPESSGGQPLRRSHAGAPPAAPPPRRRGIGWRTREAGAAAVGTAGAGVLLIARLVRTLTVLIVLLIALAIVLRDVDANAQNTIVKGIHEGANFFAGAFTGLLRFGGHPKRAITVDWGIAIVAYVLVGGIIAAAIARIGRGGVRFEETHRAAV
jgi:hypothetical protein